MIHVLTVHAPVLPTAPGREGARIPSTAMGGSWKHTLRWLGVGWPGLPYGADTWGGGLHPGPAEDKAGPFPSETDRDGTWGCQEGTPIIVHGQ